MGVSRLTSGCKAVPCCWVYTIKSGGRYKARLVAKGFKQVKDIDYDEIFSPVTRFESIRFLLAHAALNDWEVEAMDVKTAFLYGELDEEISYIWSNQKALKSLVRNTKSVVF